MDIEGSVAVVTGANRGLGRHFAAQLLERGAAKVYAAARNPAAIDLPGVVHLRLDITDPESVAAAASAAGDATLLVNNAGTYTHATLLDGEFDDIRLEMETHFFGTLRMTRAFAPVLAANGGGAVLTVLSVLSWVHSPVYGGYSAAKAAAWSQVNSLRQQLAPLGVDMTALHVGYLDTDMAAHVDEPKNDPAVVAATALDGVQQGTWEVVADEFSQQVKSALSSPPEVLYQ